MKIFFNVLSILTTSLLLVAIVLWIDPEIVANLIFANSYLPVMLTVILLSTQSLLLFTNSILKATCYTTLIVINLYLMIWRVWNLAFLLASTLIIILCWWLSKVRSDKVRRNITSSSESGGKDEENR